MSEVEVGTKRSGDFDEYGEISSFKKPRSRGNDDDGKDRLRFLVQGRFCGAIIGKGGENIKRMRSEYGCTIKVQDTKSEGVLTLSGDRDSCASVFKEVLPLIPEAPYPVMAKKEKSAFEVNFLVQADRVGSVIGKGGQRIKEIRDESNCRITAYQDRLPGSNERIVAIGGEDESCVLAAFDIILKQLDEYPLRKETIYYDPKNSEGGHQGHRSQGGRGGPHGNNDHMMGPNDRMMGPPNPPILPGGGLGALGNLGNLGGLGAAGILGQLGLGGLGGAGALSGALGGALGGAGALGGGAGVGGMHGGNNMMGNGGDRRRDEERERGGYRGNDNRERGGRRDQHHNNNNSNQEEQVETFGDMETEMKITVPNDICGAIIGKGGQRIREIRQSSGAHIETTESEKGSQERRVVTITGKQRQIVVAQQMMAECVQQRFSS